MLATDSPTHFVWIAGALARRTLLFARVDAGKRPVRSPQTIRSVAPLFYKLSSANLAKSTHVLDVLDACSETRLVDGTMLEIASAARPTARSFFAGRSRHGQSYN
ncbi:hypothetical protein CBL_07358 [Carabus blaptoides fortunei]